MKIKVVSIIIPCFNEAKTIITVLEQIASIELIRALKKEIILINDGSEDETLSLVKNFSKVNKEVQLKVISNSKNKGKGASIRKGIQSSTGDFILIQDADLEYSPKDYNNLLFPLINDGADVVYGSRFMGSSPHRVLFFWHSVANWILTILSNCLTNINLTDMETGFKVFKSDILKSLSLNENRFGFEPEVTAKLSKLKGIKIYEIGISYYGRSYEEGKKITWIDGLRAVYCIFRYHFFK
jgi:glycosyltransferase involved in cell wall biosynthesis